MSNNMLTRPLVVMLGLGKSGTQTTNTFFNCAGWNASHWSCKSVDRRPEFCATCVLRWLANTMPAINDLDERRIDHAVELRRECGNFDVFSQIDVATSHTCVMPQLFFLHALLARLPNACFLMTYRSESSWIESVAHWGSLKKRTLASCPLFPKNDSGLAAYYAEHKMRVRAALAASNVCRLEVDIERENLTEKLNDFFQLNASKRCLATHAHKTHVNKSTD